MKTPRFRYLVYSQHLQDGDPEPIEILHATDDREEALAQQTTLFRATVAELEKKHPLVETLQDERCMVAIPHGHDEAYRVGILVDDAQPETHVKPELRPAKQEGRKDPRPPFIAAFEPPQLRELLRADAGLRAERDAPAFTLTVTFRVGFTEEEVQILEFLALHHYDGACKQLGAQGGLIFGLRNRLAAGFDKDVVHTDMEWRDVDTMAKLLEMASYMPTRKEKGMALAARVHMIFAQLRSIQNTLNGYETR